MKTTISLHDDHDDRPAEAVPRHGRVGSRYARLRARIWSTGRERGAALIEFALVAPILITLTFGVIEYSAAFHDSSVTADAARAGGRVGSAQATNPDFATSIVASVNAALSTLPPTSPKELWIYKANPTGYPGSATSFSSCSTNCIKYTWSPAAKAFDTGSPQGGGWLASSHQVCRQPFDELGVYVKIDHSFVTGLFGQTITLTDHSVFRFEPVPASVCAS